MQTFQLRYFIDYIDCVLHGATVQIHPIYSRVWVLLHRSQMRIYFLRFSKTSNLFYLKKKDDPVDLWTQNNLLYKYFSTYFQNWTIFWESKRWTFRIVCLNIWFKLTRYEFCRVNLKYMLLFLFFPSLAIHNSKI